jgi:hypothetical protein
MDTQEALDSVKEVSVTASETKQVQQYEPSSAEVEYKASVGDEQSAEILQHKLGELAQEHAKRLIARRVEQQVKDERED